MTWKEEVEEVLTSDYCGVCEVLAVIARMMADYMDRTEDAVCAMDQTERIRQLQQLEEAIRGLTKPMKIDVKVNAVGPTDDTEEGESSGKES